MIWVGFARLAKNVRVGFVANPLILAFRGTKVLPSACASVRDLAGYPGTVEISTSIPKFIAIQPRIKRPISQSIPLAPAEIRDAVFRELIKISPASNYREELVTGPGGLLSLIQRYSRFMKSPHPVEQEKAEVELNQLMDRIRVITEATLLTTGFHTHKRQWRKMRNG